MTLEGAVTGEWGAIASGHEVWSRVVDGAVEPTRSRAVTLLRHLAELRAMNLPALAADPWQDLGLASRTSARLSRLLPPDAVLSADEAALLVCVPFLHDALWAQAAARGADLRPEDLTTSVHSSTERADFERFSNGYPRLRRRADIATALGRSQSPAEIGWWLLHRWSGRRPESYQPAAVAALLPDGAGAGFDAHRLAGLLRAMRAEPTFLAGADGIGTVGYLLAVAHALAIELVALPEVIAEHLGIGDPVLLPELRATVDGAHWQPQGSALVLDAACAHPAVEVALRGHVDTVNRLLTEAHRHAAARSAVLLKSLPTHVTTDRLRAAQSGPDAGRAYQSAGVRFRLAEDRVQELLMGEQLYGDPALAIRELYQNALDACRYRQARTEYLMRTRDLMDPWVGKIRFEQGTDESGRPYLDCSDNGIGMGVRELGEIFAQAGVRLGDLPEFLEEKAQWAALDPPVELFPNGRFGIGVLSYFMLADEITVDTCRLGRDGTPGERLRVSIAGPGNLFRIRSLGSGTESGTTVRLHLRTDTRAKSCVDLLRETLWVADFDTEAVDGAVRQNWRAGELSDATPVANQSTKGRPGAGVVPAASGVVWWCQGAGAILADGLAAGTSAHGAVVNLSREYAPQLSVDRTKIISYRDEDVEALLVDAIPAVATPDSPLMTPDWVGAMGSNRPRTADLILDWAISAGLREWSLGGETVDVTTTGCFQPDRNLPDLAALAEWRLTALAAAGWYGGIGLTVPDGAQIVRARPSDYLLLSVDLDGTKPWLDPAEPVKLAHLLRAARRIGRTVGEVVARLRELGYPLADGYAELDSDPDDSVLTSRDLDGSRPWLDLAVPVPLPHLLRAQHRTGRTLREIAARLTRIGYELGVDLDSVDLATVTPDDLILMSKDADGVQPWVPGDAPVPLAHLMRVAQKTGRPIAEVSTRLFELGYPIAVDVSAVAPEADDYVLVSRDLDGNAPWLDATEPVPPVHLIRAADTTGRSIRDVATRLITLGHTIGGGNDTIVAITVAHLDTDDIILTSRDLDGVAPWLSGADPVPLAHLLRAAEETRRSVGDLAIRLGSLGYTIGVGHDTVGADPDDLVLISRDLDAASPWLDTADPVVLPQLLRAAHRIRRTPSQIAARLTALGYVVDATPEALQRADSERPELDDLILASRDLDGSAPWLDAKEPVALPQMVRAAMRTRRSLAEVSSRLAAFGYHWEVDLSRLDVSLFDAEDLVLASDDLDGSQPWVSAKVPVPVLHVVNAAVKTRRSVADVTARLAAMGYPVADVEQRLPRGRPGDA